MPGRLVSRMDPWRLIITGCGTSHGNPAWGDRAWWSTDPRDARRRSGAILCGPQGEVVLIDTGPDLLAQLRDPYRTWDGVSYPEQAITRCDAVLLTHDHADHSHGLNDLRFLNRLMYHDTGRSLPLSIHGDARHLAKLTAMFPYCFGDGEEFYRLSAPVLVASPLTLDACVSIAGLDVIPFPMSHGAAGLTTGFRIGSMAYLTDLKELPAAADQHLVGLDLLVLDMLREQPHSTNLCWEEALAVVDRLRPRRTVFTHMGPEVRFAEWVTRMPPDIDMAVDGWTATFAPTLRE